MKKNFYFIMILIGVVFTGCFNESDNNVVLNLTTDENDTSLNLTTNENDIVLNLTANKNNISAYGADIVDLKVVVKAGDNTMETESIKIYVNDALYNRGLEFSTEKAGEYIIYAELGDQKSNVVIINATKEMVLVEGNGYLMGDWNGIYSMSNDAYTFYGMNIKDPENLHGREFNFDAFVHPVIIDSFYVSTHEENFGEYKEYLTSGTDVVTTEGAIKAKIVSDYATNSSMALPPGIEKNITIVTNENVDDWLMDDKPVVGINWYDAVKYANWKSEKDGLDKCYTINNYDVSCDFSKNGYRLPTEAEWEYVAKGGKYIEDINAGYGNTFSGTSDKEKLGDYAWYSKNSEGKTHPICTKLPNELGIHDMTGNVWEYMWDYYNPDYYNASESNNPTGPAEPMKSVDGVSETHLKILRGSSWGQFGDEIYNPSVFCKTSFRFMSIRQYMMTDSGSPYIYSSWRTGFRLVRTMD